MNLLSLNHKQIIRSVICAEITSLGQTVLCQGGKEANPGDRGGYFSVTPPVENHFSSGKIKKAVMTASVKLLTIQGLTDRPSAQTTLLLGTSPVLGTLWCHDIRRLFLLGSRVRATGALPSKLHFASSESLPNSCSKLLSQVPFAPPSPI